MNVHLDTKSGYIILYQHSTKTPAKSIRLFTTQLNNWIPEQVVPALTVGRFQVLFHFLQLLGSGSESCLFNMRLVD
jgi:hypothetical protein